MKNYFSLFFKNNEKSDRKRKIHNYIFRNFSMILSLQKKKNDISGKRHFIKSWKIL